MENRGQKTKKTQKIWEKIQPIGLWIMEKRDWALWLIALILLAVFSFLWKDFIIDDQWPEDRANAYRLEIQSKEPNFHKSQFESVIEKIENNQKEKESEASFSSNIFRLK